MLFGVFWQSVNVRSCTIGMFCVVVISHLGSLVASGSSDESVNGLLYCRVC